MTRSRPFIGGIIVLYFIIGLEVLVMISPFAAFFYAAFNPFLLLLARWQATHWLADFFLPHMVVPPSTLLKIVRVGGSVCFVGGVPLFLLCAGQVYFHKLTRRGPALGGLYRWIRHPQYVALAVTGIGLSILWPRFLTLVLWVVMVGLYYALARDEERRMMTAFGDQYGAYMDRTGMFLPRQIEHALTRIPFPLPLAIRLSLAFALLLALIIGSAAALRQATIEQLPLWSNDRASVLAVLPGDMMMLEHRMSDVLQMPEVEAKLAQGSGAILAYVVPTHYVMQGMIADTNPAYRLYEHHQTIPMIIDWIFHPFRHLEGGHAMTHHQGAQMAVGEPPTVRRIIFLRVVTNTDAPVAEPSSLLAIGAVRVPQFFVDVDLHTLTLQNIQDLRPGTGWGNVPAPTF